MRDPAHGAVPAGRPSALLAAAAGMLDAQNRFEASARRAAADPLNNLEQETVQRIQDKTAFSANAAVLKTADEMTGALLDILA